jgi:hypothetical protein
MNAQTSIANTPYLKKLQTLSFALIALGAVITGATIAVSGMERFYSTYILGMSYFVGISVTALFFTALQYLARAGWSAGVRRIAENMTGMITIILVAFLPIIVNVFSAHPVYEWVHLMDSDPLIHAKAGYLNPVFFSVRLALYALLWFGMTRYIVGNSVKQDGQPNDITPTLRNMKFAAPVVLLYALTITFCAIDVLMSLEPHWFSTIFGVYYFAGSFVSALSIITIIVVTMRRAGLLKGTFRDEHYHDLGKLMFAFSVFWTYIAFSQYFIIWYANLPEETIYFTARMSNGWETFGYLLIVTHFVLPFMLLLRQDVKRKENMLLIGATVILLSHFIDLYWIVGPVFSKGQMNLGWQDFGGWFLFAGLFLFFTARNFAKRNAVAIGDPLLHESAEYHT